VCTFVCAPADRGGGGIQGTSCVVQNWPKTNRYSKRWLVVHPEHAILYESQKIESAVVLIKALCLADKTVIQHSD
jgi:hypothetical protein